MGIRTAVKQVLIVQQDKKYEKELAQLKVTYEQWAAEQDRESAEPREIAGLVEFIIFRQAAGRLADNATERINAYFTKHPEAEIVYGDEDLMNEKGERCIPWYKPVGHRICTEPFSMWEVSLRYGAVCCREWEKIRS